MTPAEIAAIRERNAKRKARVAEIDAINDDAERNIGHGYRPLTPLNDEDAAVINDVDALLAEVERLRHVAKECECADLAWRANGIAGTMCRWAAKEG